MIEDAGSLGIRRARTEDEARLGEIVEAAPNFNDAEKGVAKELIGLALNDAKSGYRIVVADAEGATAGYCCFGATPMTKSTYDVYWIVVAQDLAGKGIGSALLLAAEGIIRNEGGKRIRIETSEKESYGGARKLYAKCGYSVAGTIEDFYSDGDHLRTYLKVL